MTEVWIPVSEAVPDGTQCLIRIRDPFGSIELRGAHFLHDDGLWYKIEPPTQIAARVTHFKPI